MLISKNWRFFAYEEDLKLRIALAVILRKSE